MSCDFLQPDDLYTCFLIKHAKEKAQDSTQDVRLEALHCFSCNSETCVYCLYCFGLLPSSLR